MTTELNTFTVLSGYKNTKVFLNNVRDAADAHRNSFGFLPASVYDEFARNDRLYVLVENSPHGQCYAGHLLATPRYPRASIVQMFTLPHYRQRGLATILIDHYRAELTHAGFTSIYASVAEDLVEANAFWDRQRFHIQTVKKGGDTRKRKILRRCHELESPQLFPSSGINKHNPLGLTAPAGRNQLFLLDLNVLFDLAGPRRIRHAEAVSLFQVERMQLCKLAISTEIREELHRTASSGKLDPMEGIVDILASFPLKKFDVSDPTFKDISALVFPNKEALTANDKSDVCHIYTAIQHRLAGLITNDGAVLESAPEITKKYGIEILSPTAFTLDEDQTHESSFESEDNNSLTLRVIEDKQYADVHSFLSQQGVSAAEMASEWLPTGAGSRVASRFSIWEKETLIGYITWSIAAKFATIVARIAVDKAHTNSADAARIMLTYLLEQLPQQGPRRINLATPPFQPSVREVANLLGFRGHPDHEGLQKIVLGEVLTTKSWPEFQALLVKNSGIKLPDDIPRYQHPDQPIPVITPDGNRPFIALDELESLLSPVLFCLPGRPAVITPIQRVYAEPLLGHSTQASLLPSCRASLFQDRHYISSNRTLTNFNRGALVLFYESAKGQGRSAVVAIARVRRSYLKQFSELAACDLDQSVLTSAQVASVGRTKTRTVTVFDNIFILPRAVPFAILEKFGCGSKTKLISTNPITDEQLQKILQEAFSHEQK